MKVEWTLDHGSAITTNDALGVVEMSGGRGVSGELRALVFRVHHAVMLLSETRGVKPSWLEMAEALSEFQYWTLENDVFTFPAQRGVVSATATF